MGKHVHSLILLDPTTRTGNCKNCGPVKVQQMGGGKWRCATGARQIGIDHYKYAYGITRSDVMSMALKQSGACAICKQTAPLVVDHNHETGAVRALLCYRCNSGLGQFLDSTQLLSAAIDYLKSH